ncbi:MAG: alkaline phosphatase family protein [Gemmatimonadaceae bacterium]|nr:alkaline phosphatase family protein [Gemmatimonadaceae bacterium]
MTERRSTPRAGPLLRAYYNLKYRPFKREKRKHDGRRGLIALQIDALAYADLQRALERGYCPQIAALLQTGEFQLRKWFCGLPSATPYCQAGIFHGENGGIPAFRFYDKQARRVITCNSPHGVQYIRDRIKSPGALAGGSSYVNLIDGDAETVAFTIATRQKMSVYRRLGGNRMALLLFLHPIRIVRIAVHSVLEFLLEEWERLRGELARRVTHSEGIFPFIRILSNVVVRELQTMAILLDIYLGVPIIYSTFMQYDELAHHFGPSSKQALFDLKRTDRRISEIYRMIRMAGGRGYDLVILSDHGMTAAQSYRVNFGETLGSTVERLLRESATGARAPESLASFSSASEYADVGPEVMETVAELASPPLLRKAILRLSDWLRSRYGLRELILPEKFRVDTRNEVVITYSSCLAHVYFAARDTQLSLAEMRSDARWNGLYAGLLAHEGVGLIATRTPEGVHLETREGAARVSNGATTVLGGKNPFETYGMAGMVARAVESLVMQPNSGDCVLFGAYDGSSIISFDDQIGAHGSAGGDQVLPFIIGPTWLDLENQTLEDARDIHRAVMTRYPRDARG